MTPPLLDAKPLIALTMGDVAGIGPEVIARSWSQSSLHALARPFVVGRAQILDRARDCVGSRVVIQPIAAPEHAEPSEQVLPCLDPGLADLEPVPPGTVDARAGRAAYQCLMAAADWALSGRIDAITTLPLNKESLRRAGVPHPGHTEILARYCGVADHAMMLYLAPPQAQGPWGLGVIHVTLHVALREVFDLLTVERVRRAIVLADQTLRPLTEGRPPRIAVAGLNPHAGENGLFGDEEIRIISPAVAEARASGLDLTGPIAADTLFRRALSGDFDAVVAMYHDQGHVALKTLGFDHAVNVTLGLPIVRTSVAHGTAFDIAWQARARTTSLIEAVRVAARLVAGRRALARPTPAP